MSFVLHGEMGDEQEHTYLGKISGNIQLKMNALDESNILLFQKKKFKD